MRARRHVHQLVEFMDSIRTGTGAEEGEWVVGNPCLAQGTRRVVEVGARNVTMDGEEIGSFEGCKRIMELVMAKDVYVPPLLSLSFLHPKLMVTPGYAMSSCACSMACTSPHSSTPSPN